MFEMLRTVLDSLAVSFDLPILDWIAENLQCGFLNAVMPVITLLGDAGIFWIVLSLALLFFPQYRKTGLGMIFSLIIGLLVCNVIMKPLFARPRPYDYQLEHFGKTITLLVDAHHDFSFPSGHTIASFEAAVVLLLGSRKLGIPAIILASLIAFSRLYLYVHYPTDVVFGALFGAAYAFIASWVVDTLWRLYDTKQEEKKQKQA